MSDADDCLVFHKGEKIIKDLFFRNPIQPGSKFIHYENLGIADECPCQGYALLLALGKGETLHIEDGISFLRQCIDKIPDMQFIENGVEGEIIMNMPSHLDIVTDAEPEEMGILAHIRKK